MLSSFSPAHRTDSKEDERWAAGLFLSPLSTQTHRNVRSLSRLKGDSENNLKMISCFPNSDSVEELNGTVALALSYAAPLTLILPRSRTGTVWFYTSTSNKRAARPKLYTKSLTRDLKLMFSRLTLVRISINL